MATKLYGNTRMTNKHFLLAYLLLTLFPVCVHAEMQQSSTYPQIEVHEGDLEALKKRVKAVAEKAAPVEESAEVSTMRRELVGAVRNFNDGTSKGASIEKIEGILKIEPAYYIFILNRINIDAGSIPIFRDAILNRKLYERARVLAILNLRKALVLDNDIQSILISRINDASESKEIRRAVAMVLIKSDAREVLEALKKYVLESESHRQFLSKYVKDYFPERYDLLIGGVEDSSQGEGPGKKVTP